MFYYATASGRYAMDTAKAESFPMFVQRKGERCEDYDYSAFLCSAQRDHLEALTEDYPKRWNAEEFYRHHQDLGWNRAGTMNLNIRFAGMTLALFAQAATYMLRQKLPEKCKQWNAKHLANNFFKAIDGDIRVEDDTIIVTYYNAPDSKHLAEHYSELPKKLENENVDPRIPWLFGFKLDFRFK